MPEEHRSESREIVTLRDFVEHKMAFLRELMDAKFEANAAAIGKQEKSQKEHDQVNNKFREQLSKQAETFVTRQDVERTVSIAKSASDLERLELRSLIDALGKRITDLEKFRNEYGGSTGAQGATKLFVMWVIGMIVTIVISGVAVVVSILRPK